MPDAAPPTALNAPDDARAYRAALGAFATGVAVVTILDPQGPEGSALGVTINSFTSVSLSPRLVLWCADEASARGKAFVAADRFVINILPAGDRHVSDRFARGDGYRLAPHEVEPGPDGAPLLRGALTRLSCRLSERRRLGDHWVLVGEVAHYDTRPGDGLVYFRGRYDRTGQAGA